MYLPDWVISPPQHHLLPHSDCPLRAYTPLPIPSTLHPYIPGSPCIPTRPALLRGLLIQSYSLFPAPGTYAGRPAMAGPLAGLFPYMFTCAPPGGPHPKPREDGLATPPSTRSRGHLSLHSFLTIPVIRSHSGFFISTPKAPHGGAQQRRSKI